MNIPNLRFEIKDRFNMFYPNANKDDSILHYPNMSVDQTEMHIANQPYKFCEVQLYKKGRSATEDAYFCYHSNLSRIFVRNFKNCVTEKIIDLDYCPTAVHI